MMHVDGDSVCTGTVGMRAEVPGGGKLNNSKICSNLFPHVCMYKMYTSMNFWQSMDPVVYKMYTSMYFWQSMDPFEQVRMWRLAASAVDHLIVFGKKQRVIFELLVVLYAVLFNHGLLAK
jgi:hypothetical protein